MAKTSMLTSRYIIILRLPLPAMESTRLKKVSRLIERDLGEIFQQMAKNHFKGTLISVTKARVSSDLGVARIYVSIFPAKQGDEILKYIQEHTSFVRNELAQRAGKQLRIIPELRFFLDDSLDYEENIDRLLRGEGENPIK
jgi:ribosome-binding factor A